MLRVAEADRIFLEGGGVVLELIFNLPEKISDVIAVLKCVKMCLTLVYVTVVSSSAAAQVTSLIAISFSETADTFT